MTTDKPGDKGQHEGKDLCYTIGDKSSDATTIGQRGQAATAMTLGSKKAFRASNMRDKVRCR